MKLSFSMEHTSRPGVVRGLVFNTTEHEHGDITNVHNIAEGTVIGILNWLTDHYPGIRYVRQSDGTLDEPDCLTVYEAAEAAMVPRGDWCSGCGRFVERCYHMGD